MVTVLPPSSARLTSGCVAHGSPPVPPPGWALNTRWVGAPATTVKAPLVTVGRPADVAESVYVEPTLSSWQPVKIARPAFPLASTPMRLTFLSSRKPENIPIALLPPPTHANTISGSRPSFLRHCFRASLPIQLWKCLTIVGYGWGPAAVPKR